MTNEIIQRVRAVLHDSVAMTLESLCYLIGEAEAEAERLRVAVDQDKAQLLSIDTPEDQYSEIEARIVRSEMNHARLAGAIPRLHDLRSEMAKVELAVRQDERYAAIKARCRAIQSIVDRAYDETIPQLASALIEYRQLQNEIGVFNDPAPSHKLANPQDRLVKRYKRINQPVADAVLKGLRLVAKDGVTLYAPVDPPKPILNSARSEPPATINRAAPEKEVFRQAQERQVHAQTILRGLRHEAEARGIKIEQAAAVEGIDEGELARYREQAEGKHVAAARDALLVALQHAAENERQSTS